DFVLRSRPAQCCLMSSIPHLLFLFSCSVDHLNLHSFPTRRSSDLLLERLSLKMLLKTWVLNLLKKLQQKLMTLLVMVLQLQLFRSEEHTSELQSSFDLVCRLLLEKKKINTT